MQKIIHIFLLAIFFVACGYAWRFHQVERRHSDELLVRDLQILSLKERLAEAEGRVKIVHVRKNWRVK